MTVRPFGEPGLSNALTVPCTVPSLFQMAAAWSGGAPDVCTAKKSRPSGKAARFEIRVPTGRAVSFSVPPAVPSLRHNWTA
jgi:hypothetical protein